LPHAEDTAAWNRWATLTGLPAMEMITVRPTQASVHTRRRKAVSHRPVTRALTGDARPCPPGLDAGPPGCAGTGHVRTYPQNGVVGHRSAVSAAGHGLVPREDTTRLRASRRDQHAEGQSKRRPRRKGRGGESGVRSRHAPMHGARLRAPGTRFASAAYRRLRRPWPIIHQRFARRPDAVAVPGARAEVQRDGSTRGKPVPA
jgi:hypothetical protein